MFRISDSHWRAFEESQVQRFVESQTKRLRSAYPDTFAARFTDDATKLQHVVLESIELAETFGVIAEDDVAFYLNCLFEIGFDFARVEGWAYEILHRRDLGGEAKMDLIWKRLHPDELEEKLT